MTSLSVCLSVGRSIVCVQPHHLVLQVCSLQWSQYNKELVSSHGFSENQLCLWKYPTMLKIKEFRGHTSRCAALSSWRWRALASCLAVAVIVAGSGGFGGVVVRKYISFVSRKSTRMGHRVEYVAHNEHS